MALSEQGGRVRVHSAAVDSLANGGRAPAGSKSLGVETNKKRKLQAMQSDGQVLGTTAKAASDDTPDGTSSEDEHSRGPVHVDAGLPPKVPVKVAVKAALMSEGVAAAQVEDARPADQARCGKTTAAKGLEAAVKARGRPDAVRPSVATKKAKLNPKGKTKPVDAVKKVPAKSKRLDQRHKRRQNVGSEDAGISQASARMLFQCSTQLLRSQALDYDVRARKMEERNARQAKEIEEWERKVRALKRELQGYEDELPDARLDESAGLALIEAKPRAAGNAGLDEHKRPSTDVAYAAPVVEHQVFAAPATVESSLPPAVLAAESKLQEELRKRTQKVNEFCRSVPGFIDSLDKPVSRQL